MQLGNCPTWDEARIRKLRELHAGLRPGDRDWRAAFAARLGVSAQALIAKLGREYRAGRMSPVPVHYPTDAGRRRRRPGPKPKPAAADAREEGGEDGGLQHTGENGDQDGDNAAFLAAVEAARRERLALIARLDDLALPISAARTCQWPMWANDRPRPTRGEGVLYCGGQPAAPGLSWCRVHAPACMGHRRPFAGHIPT